MGALLSIVGLFLSTLALMAPSAAAQTTTSGEPGSLRGCIESAEKVRVLYVIDESGSLKFTDAEDNRITAAKVSLGSFLKLSVEKPVEIRLAGFSSDFRDLADDTPAAQRWVELNQDSALGLQSQIDEFAFRNEGIDTDLPLALAGALDALEPVEPDTCNLIALFADGGYDIKTRASEQDQQEFGLEKPYAPGVPLDTAAGVADARVEGRKALCDIESGTMSKIDEAGVRIITVALAESDFIDTSLLESLTTGRSEQTVCGEDRSGSRGVFSPVDADSLGLSLVAITGQATGAAVAASSIAVCNNSDDECSSEVPIEVDSLISQFDINAQFKDPSQELLLTDPNGELARIGFSRDREIGLPGAVLKANWLDEQAVTVTVIPTGNSELEPGQWTVAAYAASEDAEPANLLVTRSGNLKTVIPAGDPLIAGDVGLVSATVVTTTTGRPIDGSQLRVEAVLTDNRSTELTLDLQDTADGEGTFSQAIEIPADFIGPADIEVRVVGTTSDNEEFTSSAKGIVRVETIPTGDVNVESDSVSTKLGQLGLLGLALLAALLVWFFIWRSREASDARFDLEGLNVSSTPIVIRGDGALFRIDGDARPLALARADFHPHPDPAASRVVNLPTATLKVSPAKHPFDERNAFATSDSPIASKYESDDIRSADIDATLGGTHGTWLFVMDEEHSLLANVDTSDPAHGSIAGELLVIIEPSVTDVPRLFGELPEQLVPAARILLREVRKARASNNEDASTADMLDWVDQWAGDKPAAPVD